MKGIRDAGKLMTAYYKTGFDRPHLDVIRKVEYYSNKVRIYTRNRSDTLVEFKSLIGWLELISGLRY